MIQLPIIRRTEKLREVTALLKKRKVVYISSFFYSGKTVLMDQLCETWSGKILRFHSGQDDWKALCMNVSETSPSLIVIDSIDHLSSADAEELRMLMAGLKDQQHAVLSGRAQLPTELRSLCASGAIAMLGREFMMFSEEEIIQLFLEYGLDLFPTDVHLIRERLWGWVFSLHMLAQQMQNHPGASIRTLLEETRSDIRRILISDVVSVFSEQKRQLLYNLSPFECFSEEMARMVTGRFDAPRLMKSIAEESYLLMRGKEQEYYFIPIVREALFDEMRNIYSQDYINGQYKRAALFYELQNQIPMAISYYKQLGDAEKIRELLIRDTFNRPADGDYVNLREGYALLSEETILAYPELMKGKSEIECLQGHAEESERWYQALDQFIHQTPARDARRQTAIEAKAYLDLCLSQRGSRHTLKRLLAVTKSPKLLGSAVWRNGFNVSGNSVSLMNGGLDFCRWVPHGWNIYRLFKMPIELALGPGGSGVADIAIAEGELESNLDGDYTLAMAKIREGIQRVTSNVEIRYAAVGIQCRIEAARGNAGNALHLLDSAFYSLPESYPARLEQNLKVFRYSLQLLQGEIDEAKSWMESEAPDEAKDFIIMDRYSLMLKLRLYIITAQWPKILYLSSLLRQYFESYDRPYLLVQLNLLEAICAYRTGQESWKKRMEEALSLARRYHLVRIIADEGIAIIDLLNEMDLPDDRWQQSVLSLTRRQAAHYPNYMKQAANRPIFTDREYQVYSLIIAGYKNAKIASILNISERTVKYFCGIIYKKLGVTTRAEALNRAAEMGDIK
ncbi:MAG: hypothetical protein IJ719_13720 [Clostridia bacterium]|nr:hypothetical protein [Clostridia bacterium]